MSVKFSNAVNAKKKQSLLKRCKKEETSGDDSLTEQQLLAKEYITPEDVIKLSSFTEGFLCSQEANCYDIEFTRFKIRDMETGNILFEISKPSPSEYDEDDLGIQEQEDVDPNAGRFVRYQFTSNFLKLKTVGATVEFTVGDKPSGDFMLQIAAIVQKIHFHKIKTLFIGEEMINNPFETRSDSYYFVDNKLIMHNKADYAYNGGLN
ncbi:protein unc-119 B-like protein [Dinothrombium tinctorium]|uniref:Protein unc-119 B-like protein n=1 Tax=Dinothrombium tinctorium TaxID=1965070 RepID=A0A443RI14_9ACAR|nr:protein unc-119 B-like protein [Dinothrombium tinctorium]